MLRFRNAPDRQEVTHRLHKGMIERWLVEDLGRLDFDNQSEAEITVGRKARRHDLSKHLRCRPGDANCGQGRKFHSGEVFAIRAVQLASWLAASRHHTSSENH